MIKIVLGTGYMGTNLFKSEIWLYPSQKCNETVLSAWVQTLKFGSIQPIWAMKLFWVHGYMGTYSKIWLNPTQKSNEIFLGTWLQICLREREPLNFEA